MDVQLDIDRFSDAIHRMRHIRTFFVERGRSVAAVTPKLWAAKFVVLLTLWTAKFAGLVLQQSPQSVRPFCLPSLLVASNTLPPDPLYPSSGSGKC